MNLRKLRVVASMLALTMTLGVFTGCSNKAENDAPVQNQGSETEPKDTIVIANKADIVSLDPSGQNDVVSQLVVDCMYNRLFSLDENLELYPDLAESYENPTPEEWKIKIKEGVKFHDGTEMTSEDVKASLDKAREEDTVKHVLAEIENIEIVDKYTVLITTKDAYAPFLNTLAHFGASIVPKAYLESGDNFQNPIGSGPFKYVDRVLGDKVTVERFDDYFDEEGKAKTKTLVFRAIPEGTSRTIALETGEVDAVSALETIDYDRVKENEKLALYEKPSNSVVYLGLNVNADKLDNKLVRQAINYAVDKESVLEVAINGRGEVANTVLPKSLLGYTENPSNYEYNPEKAKELLAQAGYPDGFEIELWASGDVRDRIAQVVQANLLEVGINAEISLLEWGKYIDATNSGDQQIFVIGWTAEPDPDQMLPSLFDTSSIKGQNRTEYSNPEVDKLLAEARKELDKEKRKDLYEQIQKIIMEDAPWVPLYYDNFVIAANANLKGIGLNAKAMCSFNKLTY